MSDTDFLKDYVMRNPTPNTPPPGVQVDPEKEDATIALEDKGSEKVTTPNVMKLHNKAVKQDAQDKEKAARLQAEADAQRIADEEEARKEKRQSIQDKVDDVTTKADSTVRPLIDRVANLKTVGGIGLLIAILVFLNFVIIPVNAAGDTRLKQLWYMLNGQAQIQGRVIPTAVTQGASADFGTTTTTTTTGTGTGTGTGGGGPVVTAHSNGFSALSSYRPLAGGLN